MLSKALRIVPLLALGVLAPSPQEIRDTPAPVSQSRQIGLELASTTKGKVIIKKKVKIKTKRPKKGVEVQDAPVGEV